MSCVTLGSFGTYLKTWEESGLSPDADEGSDGGKELPNDPKHPSSDATREVVRLASLRSSGMILFGDGCGIGDRSCQESRGGGGGRRKSCSRCAERGHENGARYRKTDAEPATKGGAEA